MRKPRRRRDGTWEEPAALKRMRRDFTEAKARVLFTKLRGRPPESDFELTQWVELYTLEVYNSGQDEADF